MKILKYILIAIVAIFLIGFLYLKLGMSESRPTIDKTKDAQAVATKMFAALNKPAWDSLPLIKWSFRDKNHYVWDKKNNKALIQYDDLTVHLNPDNISGKAYRHQTLLTGKEHQEAIRGAWKNWCNDMFWLAAPYKIQDPGTTLNIATDAEGKEGLLVTYASGGVTPGDAYLWYLDDTGLPTGYKMWVKIIPVGGVYTSWEDWTKVYGGARIAQNHVGMGPLKIPITNLESGDEWSDLGYDKNPIQL